MPNSVRAPQWIANFRWLLALLRRSTRKLQLSVVSFLWTTVQRLQWAPVSCARSHDDVNDIGLPPCPVPAGHGMRIMPSEQPIERGFDVGAAGASGSDSAEKEAEASGTAPNVKSSCNSQPDELSGARETVAFTASDSSHAATISDIFPIPPENFARYKYRETEPTQAKLYIVDPETLTFATDDLPSEWIAPLHPEGAKYYCHPQRRIFTDLNICDPQNLANLNQVVEHIIEQIRAFGSNAKPHYAALLGKAQNPDLLVDLVIDMDDSKSKPTRGFYYFINHSERCPFWLDSFPAQDLLLWDGILLAVETQPEQLRHAMEHQFWQHCALFPNTLHLSEQHIKELTDTIVFGIGDLSTSFTSTVAQTVEELKTWLSVAKHLELNTGVSQDALLPNGLGSAFTFARLMEQLAQGRFDNFHGLAWARLNSDQSVFKKEQQTESYFVRVISLVLFFTPAVYLHSLKKAYVDRRVIMRIWKPLIDKLNTDWQEFILVGTVILNANVAFLSVGSVDTITKSGHHSLVQIFSYLSIVASMGSIILALLLVRQNRTKFHESASDLSASLHARIREPGGLNLVAIIFSLPYALMIWSMILFFAAFLTTCMRVPDTISRSTIGVVVVIVSVCILWCIWDARLMDVHASEPVKAEADVKEEEEAFGAPFGHTLLSSRFSTRISTLKLKERFVGVPRVMKQVQRRMSTLLFSEPSQIPELTPV